MRNGSEGKIWFPDHHLAGVLVLVFFLLVPGSCLVAFNLLAIIFRCVFLLELPVIIPGVGFLVQSSTVLCCLAASDLFVSEQSGFFLFC